MSLLSDRYVMTRTTSEAPMRAGMMSSRGLGTSKEIVFSAAFALAGTYTLNDGL